MNSKSMIVVLLFIPGIFPSTSQLIHIQTSFHSRGNEYLSTGGIESNWVSQSSPQDLEESQEVDLERPETWPIHNPSESRVEFKMPEKPRLSERMFTPIENQPPIKVRNYVGSYQQGNRVMVVNYHDLPELPGEELVDVILESALVGSVANLNGKVLDQKKIRYEEYPGREYRFRFARGETVFRGISRVFLVGQRQYMISLMMKEEEFNDKLADEFLASFRLEEKPAENQQSEAGSDGSASQTDGAIEK